MRIFFGIYILIISNVYFSIGFRLIKHNYYQQDNIELFSEKSSYQYEWITQKLDHFNRENLDTFEMVKNK